MRNTGWLFCSLLLAVLLACTDAAGPVLDPPLLAASSALFPGGGASIALQKTTNGMDADEGPGPSVAPGEPVVWEYTVTNTGSLSVSGISVEDDKEGLVCFLSGPLAPGESASCTLEGAALEGQYMNLGTAMALTPTFVQATDPSHYTGQVPETELPAGMDVQVLIKPGSEAPCLNPFSKGRMPVAILSSMKFDATAIDPSTVVAGESTEPDRLGRPEDVNGDGMLDMVVHLRTQALNDAGLLQDGADLVISGQTLDGSSFSGSDLVRLVRGVFCR